MNKHIIVIGKEDSNYNNFEKLNYISVYDVKDKSKKRLIYAKLNYEDNRLLIETDYLNLLEVDLSKNYFKVELNETTRDLLENIDNRGVELMDNLLNCNEEVKEMNLDINGEFSYITLKKVDSQQNSYLRVRLCENSKVYLNNKEINKDEIDNLKLDTGDMIRFLLEIDSINIYPQENICGLKNFCLFIDIKKKIDETIFTRTKIDNYKFSNNKLNNNKIILEDYDLSYLRTDVSPKSDDDNNDNNDNNDNKNKLEDKLEEENIFVSVEDTKKPKSKPKRKPSNKKII